MAWPDPPNYIFTQDNLPMANLFEGRTTPSPNGRFAVVVARYNQTITQKLLEGALSTFSSRQVPDNAIDVAWVPGAWEIPLVAQRLAYSSRYQAIVCLGAVIRGETTHDRHINRQVSLSLGRIGLEADLPIVFGVLTCNSVEQAIHRAGGNVGNKGSECAEAAMEMAGLMDRLPQLPSGQQEPRELAKSCIANPEPKIQSPK